MAKHQSFITPLNILDFNKLTVRGIKPPGLEHRKAFSNLSLKFRDFWITWDIFCPCARDSTPMKLFQTLVVSFFTTFLPSAAQMHQQEMLKSMMMQLRL